MFFVLMNETTRNRNSPEGFLSVLEETTHYAKYSLHSCAYRHSFTGWQRCPRSRQHHCAAAPAGPVGTWSSRDESGSAAATPRKATGFDRRSAGPDQADS